jgi:phosphoribosylglycinamide formyltransferase-1
VDNGPVLATEIVPIHSGDTLEALEARVHDVEHRILVAVLRKLSAEKAEPLSSAAYTKKD